MKYLKYFAASLTGIKKGVLPVWIGMNVMIAAIAVFAGYAGAIDPEKMPFSGIVAMTFPVWWIANVACLVINLILCRRLLPVPLDGPDNMHLNRFWISVRLISAHLK